MKRIAILLATFMSLSANAEFFTGNELLSYITGQNTGRKMIAIGYVQGVYDTGTGFWFCPPPVGVTAGQILDMTRMSIEASPENRHYPADMLVRKALVDAWPCKRTGSGS